MIKKIGFIFLLIAITVVSCSIPPVQSLPSNPTLSEEQSVDPTLQEETIEPSFVTTIATSTSPTPQLYTPTPEITDTPYFTETPIPPVFAEARLELRCLDVDPNSPATGIYSGTAVLAGYYQEPTYLLDMATGSMQPLLEYTEQSTFEEAVSPDHKSLVYQVLNPSLLIVKTSVGEHPSISIPWEENWFGMDGWLNDQNLRIYLDDGSEIMFNPFTGEQQSLFSNFPDYAEPIGVAAGWWWAQYNPGLTRSVYPQYPGENGNSVALWNLQTNESVANFYSYGFPFGVKPVWSPTGDEFIMSLYHEDEEDGFYTELYRISQDGDQTKLTNLRAYYTEYLWINEYQWSPDGSQVAFWIKYTLGDQSNDQLAVMDMETLQVTNYCVDGRWSMDQEPVWSPDSRQLIINGMYGEDSAVLLLDLDNQTVYQIAGDLRAIGWLDRSP